MARRLPAQTQRHSSKTLFRYIHHEDQHRRDNGCPLLAALVHGKVTVNGAKVMHADIDASNGAIHAIDAVIMPKGVMLAAAA
jgi:uncharacterized surface protein with fasciclin (FAS1) repeats